MTMHSMVYGRIESLLAGGACVLLDGGVGTEVARGESAASGSTADPPGTWAIYDRMQRALEVHRTYAAVGCDVISTHTWGLLSSSASVRGRRPGRTGLPAWTVATRDAVALARQGIAEAGRAGKCAVAFSLNDSDPLLAAEQDYLRLLWTIDPPDLVLVETLPCAPSPALCRAIAALTATGLPVWASFRCAPAAGGDPPGSFTTAVRELEGAGVAAVLINCIPVKQTSEALFMLSDATTLPIGCYPRLDNHVDPAAYGELVVGWRAQGARIIGGCCGVGPLHIAEAHRSLVTTSIASTAERTSSCASGETDIRAQELSGVSTNPTESSTHS
jgi:homocysteine S-methyltransferase